MIKVPYRSHEGKLDTRNFNLRQPEPVLHRGRGVKEAYWAMQYDCSCGRSVFARVDRFPGRDGHTKLMQNLASAHYTIHHAVKAEGGASSVDAPLLLTMAGEEASPAGAEVDSVRPAREVELLARLSELECVTETNEYDLPVDKTFFNKEEGDRWFESYQTPHGAVWTRMHWVVAHLGHS